MAVENSWSLSFRRPLRSWEEEDLHRLVAMLMEVLEPRANRHDSFDWKANSTGILSVNSLFKWVEADWGIANNIYCHIWNNTVPPKVQFFIWLV